MRGPTISMAGGPRLSSGLRKWWNRRGARDALRQPLKYGLEDVRSRVAVSRWKLRLFADRRAHSRRGSSAVSSCARSARRRTRDSARHHPSRRAGRLRIAGPSVCVQQGIVEGGVTGPHLRLRHLGLALAAQEGGDVELVLVRWAGWRPWRSTRALRSATARCSPVSGARAGLGRHQRRGDLLGARRRRPSGHRRRGDGRAAAPGPAPEQRGASWPRGARSRWR